jgi:uncharacterized protein
MFMPLQDHAAELLDRSPQASRSRDIVRRVAAEARARFGLTVGGMHGVPHWSRVLRFGTEIAVRLDVDPHPVRLFAFLHDCCRLSEGDDPEHGPRAADFAWSLQQQGLLGLDRPTAMMVAEACRWHSDGLVDGPPLIQACWDADRLDVGRVGIRPDPRRLCSDAARDPRLIDWAWHWSRRQATRRQAGHRRHPSR